MNISLAGDLGSGKTEVSKILKKRGYSYVSVGNIFRDIAKQRGVSVTDVNKLAAIDPTIDRDVDNMQIRLGKTRTKAVFDSRLGFHFVPNSLKVYLLCDKNETVRRVLGDNRKGESYASVAEAARTLSERRNLERERYYNKYGVDMHDMRNYAIIIDTTWATPSDVVRLILQFAEGKRSGKGFFFSPKSLYPTQSIRNISSHVLNKYQSEIKRTRSKFIFDKSIIVSSANGYYFIIDGHHRVLASLSEDVVFISAVSEGMRDNLTCERSWCYGYEEVGNFRYKKYPV